MNSGIYEIEVCGIYYIGSTINFKKRFERHIKELKENTHHNIILQRAFNKHGLQNLKIKILEHIVYTKELILEKEQYYIDKYKKNYRERCCNLSGASFGDTKTNHPNREKIIEKTRNAIIELNSCLTEKERKEKYGRSGPKNGMHGKTHSEEVKKKLRERSYSKEIKRKMSLAAIKKFEEHPRLKENLSETASQRTGNKNSFFGKKHTEETKKKIADKNKGKVPGNAIRVIINDKEYSSYHEASCDLGIPHTTIRWRCLSKSKKFENYKIFSD
jgi:group I intron endonuclease